MKAWHFALALSLPSFTHGHALEADRFEIHAVAAAASEHTREFLTAADVDAPARTVFLEKTVLLDGQSVQKLTLIPAHGGTPLYLNVEFTPAGQQRFGDLTTQFLHRQIGVVVDGQLIFAATVASPLYGGRLAVGKDPDEFPYPNYWRPFMAPTPPSPNPASTPR